MSDRQGKPLTVGKMLGWDIEGFAQEVLGKERRFAESFSEVNLLARQLAASTEGDSADQRVVLARVLFARLLRSSEAVACLSACGYRQDAAALLRVALEAFLKLAAVCKQPEIAERFLGAALKADRKLFDAALERDAASRTEEVRQSMKNRRDEIKELEDRGDLGQSISVRELAEKVGQSGLYDTVYRLTSNYVHSSPRALEELVAIDEYGKPKQVLLDPNAATFQMYVHTVSDFVLKGMTLLAELLQLRAPKDYKSIVRKYEELEPKWPHEVA